jgi:hypothetical protein
MQDSSLFATVQRWTWSDAFLAVLSAWVAYFVTVGIYRVYFHPLSDFPGPKVGNRLLLLALGRAQARTRNRLSTHHLSIVQRVMRIRASHHARSQTRISSTWSTFLTTQQLAALTFWYEFYFEIYPHNFQYVWKIKQLHEQYGPIVRISTQHPCTLDTYVNH